MVSLSDLIFICIWLLVINPGSCQQYYDRANCTIGSREPGSSYLCNNHRKFPCHAYIIYRAQMNYNSLSSIASLFNLTANDLLPLSPISEADFNNLKPGREIIVPVTCSCLGTFSQAVFWYNLSVSNSISEVACGVYEGLVNAQNLAEENSGSAGSESDDSMIKVPIRCACPDENDESNGVKFLVTYPVIQNDSTELIARKFEMAEQIIWKANKLQSFDTIFPLTTLLIPTTDVPDIDWDVRDSPVSPQEEIPVRKVTPGTKSVKLNLYAVLGVGVVVVASVISAFGICITILRKYHPRSFQYLSAVSNKSSTASNVSPDFLEGVSKLKPSLKDFSLEELKLATENFNQALVIGTAVYRGSIGNSYVAIERMHSEEAARHVVHILTRINHLNVVKLEGCCYETMSYVVYEFAENGSLRDCLSNSKMGKELTWTRRMQICFDVAEALHYIHYCTKPAYVHRNLNSSNVLVGMDWRAKITGFRLAKPVMCRDEMDDINWKESVVVGRNEYLAPEYLAHGEASLKVDVYAFGVVLLELLSGKEVTKEGKFWKNSVNSLVDIENSLDCLEKFKQFMDPILEGNYLLADAVCLALLAKACVEQDPSQRPTMNDVLKTLSRMV